MFFIGFFWGIAWYYKILLILLISIGLFILKIYINGQACTIENQEQLDLSKKTVIVTGGSDGIGQEVILQLAGLQANIILASRNLQKGLEKLKFIKSQTHHQYIRLLKLDLSDIKSIKEFAKKFKEDYDHLDLLINCAGTYEKTQSLTKDGFEMTMGTNYIGHFVLIHELMDSLKKSPEGAKILNITSVTSMFGEFTKQQFANPTIKNKYSGVKAFMNSKLALILMTMEIQKRLNESNIENVKCLCLNLGFVRTRFIEQFYGTKIEIFKKVLNYIVWYITKDIEQGIQTIFQCILSPFEELEGGQYYSDCQVSKLYFSNKKINELKSRELFDFTVELLKDKFSDLNFSY